jgi:hypothetical protein
MLEGVSFLPRLTRLNGEGKPQPAIASVAKRAIGGPRRLVLTKSSVNILPETRGSPLRKGKVGGCHKGECPKVLPQV